MRRACAAGARSLPLVITSYSIHYTKLYDGAQCAKFAQARGLICRAIMDSLAFSPPLVISEDEIDDMFDRFAGALKDTADWVAREGLSYNFV